MVRERRLAPHVLGAASSLKSALSSEGEAAAAECFKLIARLSLEQLHPCGGGTWCNFGSRDTSSQSTPHWCRSNWKC